MASTGAAGWQRPPLSGGAESREHEKRLAAQAAAELLVEGMRVGLGTGSTVAHLLPAIARRALPGMRFVATSLATERAARELGLAVEALEDVGELDIAIDGADQIDPAGWLVKGGGGAHTREKIVAAAARRFVVIASAEKPVREISAPVPLELVPFGVSATLRVLACAELRDVPPSPDGGLIADYLGKVESPPILARTLEQIAGVVEHGLFGPEMVSLVLIGEGDSVRSIDGAKR